MSTTIREIPFEAQARAKSSRMCGAAALCMVFRSLGIHASQHDLWEQIARRDRKGTRAARTYLLAANALQHDLSALVVRASDPWRTLRRCAAAGIRVILNHRLKADSPLGHFTVLLGVEGETVILHDPQFGPERRFDRADLLKLWLPLPGGSEIAGNTLAAFSRPGPDPATCAGCGTEVPPFIPCPGCRAPIPLRPHAVLGCLGEGCPERLWQRLFCPSCDRSLTQMFHPPA